MSTKKSITKDGGAKKIATVAKKVAPKKVVAKKVVAQKKPVNNVTHRDVKEVYLRTFTVKATIPTGQYANIQPEIVVDAFDYDSAVAYAMPKIEALFDKYLNISDRKLADSYTVPPVAKKEFTGEIKPVPMPAQSPEKVQAVPQGQKQVQLTPEQKQAEQARNATPAAPTLDQAVNTDDKPPFEERTSAPVFNGKPHVSTEEETPHYKMTHNAIKSAKNPAMLEVIRGKIEVSEKLSDLEKSILLAFVDQKVF